MDPIQCPSCSSRLNLPASAVGRQVKCPRCGHTFVAAHNDLELTPLASTRTNGSGEAAGRAWSEGARVVAPWEQDWLYPGVIRCIDGDVAFIRFDDGDRGLVSLADLRPIRIQRDDLVFARRDREQMLYYPATVLRVSGEDLEVEFEDGDRQWTTVSYVRLRRTRH